MIITSVKNEKIKGLRSLNTRKGRREMGLHLIEGERLVFDALASGIVPDTVLVAQWNDAVKARLEDMGIPFTEVTNEIMEAVCDTDSPQGICAAVKTPDTTPPAKYPTGLIVALDRIQDPGNLGTVLRTADAFGAVGILLGEGSADPFSTKTMRAAMGSTYHIPIWQGVLTQELPLLKEQGFSLVCGHLKGSETLPTTGCSKVLVIGNEANGASDEVADLCELYRLPMKGRAESLNAAIAAAILIYKLSE